MASPIRSKAWLVLPSVLALATAPQAQPLSTEAFSDSLFALYGRYAARVGEVVRSVETDPYLSREERAERLAASERQAFEDIGVADGPLYFPVALAVGSVGYDADLELAWIRETTPVEVPAVSSFLLAPVFGTCTGPPRSDGPRRATIVSVNAEGCGLLGQYPQATGLPERVGEHNLYVGDGDGRLALIDEDPPIVAVAMPRGAARQFNIVLSPGWLVAVFALGPSKPGTLFLDLAYVHWENEEGVIWRLGRRNSTDVPVGVMASAMVPLPHPPSPAPQQTTAPTGTSGLSIEGLGSRGATCPRPRYPGMSGTITYAVTFAPDGRYVSSRPLLRGGDQRIDNAVRSVISGCRAQALPDTASQVDQEARVTFRFTN